MTERKRDAAASEAEVALEAAEGRVVGGRAGGSVRGPSDARASAEEGTCWRARPACSRRARWTRFPRRTRRGWSFTRGSGSSRSPTILRGFHGPTGAMVPSDSPLRVRKARASGRDVARDRAATGSRPVPNGHGRDGSSAPVHRHAMSPAVDPAVDLPPSPGRGTVANLTLVRIIDRRVMGTPFHGARRMTRHLRDDGRAVSPKRVRRPMRPMGPMPIHRRPNAVRPAKGEGRSARHRPRTVARGAPPVRAHGRRSEDDGRAAQPGMRVRPPARRETGSEARAGLRTRLELHDYRRPHGALDGQPPDVVHRTGTTKQAPRSKGPESS
jgi:hypothetical protein